MKNTEICPNPKLGKLTN